MPLHALLLLAGLPRPVTNARHCRTMSNTVVVFWPAFCAPHWRDVFSIVRPSCSSLIRFCRPILLFVSLSSPHLPFITDHLSRPLLHLSSSLARLCDVACHVVSYSLTLSSFFCTGRSLAAYRRKRRHCRMNKTLLSCSLVRRSLPVCSLRSCMPMRDLLHRVTCGILCSCRERPCSTPQAMNERGVK